MAEPSPPQACPVRNCNYNTPITALTWDVVLGLLQAHNQAAHPAPAPAPPGGQGGHAGGGGDRGVVGKLDKQPRPQATTDMTEHDFKFFENE